LLDGRLYTASMPVELCTTASWELSVPIVTLLLGHSMVWFAIQKYITEAANLSREESPFENFITAKTGSSMAFAIIFFVSLRGSSSSSEPVDLRLLLVLAFLIFSAIWACSVGLVPRLFSLAAWTEANLASNSFILASLSHSAFCSSFAFFFLFGGILFSLSPNWASWKGKKDVRLGSLGDRERDQLWDLLELELREWPPWDDWLLLLAFLRLALGDWSRVVALDSSLLWSASESSLPIFLVQLVDSLWKRLVKLWTNRQWYFAQSQFMRTKQTEMKGNGRSIWSKMDREESNVPHDSPTLAVCFFSYAANRVDNVVLSLGYISQTHAMNKHNALSTYLLRHAWNAHCCFCCWFLSTRLCRFFLAWFVLLFVIASVQNYVYCFRLNAKVATSCF